MTGEYTVQKSSLSVFPSNHLTLSPIQAELLDSFKKLDEHAQLKLLGRIEHMAEQQASKTKNETQSMTEALEYIEDKTNIELNLYDITVSAGLGNLLYDGDIPYETVHFDASTVPCGTDYAIRIKGDNMEPKIHDGDILFIKSQSALNNSEIGIFNVEDKVVCKKINHEKKCLESLNPNYAPIYFKKHTCILVVGKVLF